MAMEVRREEDRRHVIVAEIKTRKVKTNTRRPNKLV